MADRREPQDRLMWRLLRRLLPRGFRERRAEAVLDTHVALAGGSAHARGARFWGRVAWDVVTTAVQVRVDALSGERPATSERSRAMVGSSSWGQAVTMALRSLRRSPFFTVAVVLILALGIAANVTIFRVLDRLLLSPPEHIVSPEQVKRLYVYGRSPFSGEIGHNGALAYPDYRGFTEVSSFDAFAGYSRRTLTLDVDGVAEKVDVELATASYFDLLGVRPALGRFYDAEEATVGARSRVTVLSWSYWQRRFGGDRDVLGRDLAIGRGSYTVVGVAPRGFTGAAIASVDVWLPMEVASEVESGSTQWVDATSWYMMGGVARVSGPIPRAEAEATLVRRRVRESTRGADSARVVLSPLISARGPNASDESQVARMLGVLTALVLLITCANVGNLYLARVLGRRRELAVQAALGVSRRQLFAQLIAEVAVVAVLAGALAWWIGTAAAGALFRVLLPDAALPTANGARVLGVTMALAAVTALLTGALPALRAARVEAMDVLRRGTATRRVMLLRRGLLLVQAALSVILLIGAGLFIRSLQRAQAVDFGLDTRTLVVDLELEGGIVFGDQLSSAVIEILPRVRQSALIESAAATSLPPFSGWWGLMVRSGEGEGAGSDGTASYLYAVSGDYFSTLGLPIVRGRPLTDADARPGAPLVAVVNEKLAASLWPGTEAIGRCLMVESDDQPGACSTVVGVAADFLPSLAAHEAPLVFYVPPGHPAVGAEGAHNLLVRPREGATAAMIQDVIDAASSRLRRVEVAPLYSLIEGDLRAWQLGATLLTAVGLLALLIAAAGLYSMLAFDVIERRRELGIRAALGAPSGRLVRGAVGASFGFIAAGVVLGIAASLASGRAVESMLFRVTANDPAVYLGVSAVMLIVAAAAGTLPAIHVTRTDPAIPLRED